MKTFWRKIPFVRLMLPLLGGIGASTLWPATSPYAYTGLAALLLMLFLLWWRERRQPSPRYFVLLNLCLALIGWTRGSQYDERLPSTHFEHQVAQTPFGEWRVSVVSMPETRGDWVRFLGRATAVDSQAVTGRILVSLSADSLARAVRYGDELLVRGAPQVVASPLNPYQFDYARYLHFQNIHYQKYARAADWLPLARGTTGWRGLRAIYAFRRMSLQALAERLRPSTFAVASALVLGDKSQLDEELQAAYADTGAIHVLAVSGLHVGIVAMVLNFLIGLFIGARSRWRWLKVVVVIAGLWAFALLTGGAPSVLRASTMFTFLSIGIYNRTPSSIYNNLSISAFLLLVWNPYLLHSVGFQLSYCAVLGIVYFQPKIYRLWYAPNRVMDYVWQLTAVSIGAQLGTLPLSLLYFHQFPLLFFVSGLIVIPLAAVVLSLGLLLMGLAPWWHWGADVVGVCMDWVLWVQNTLIAGLGRIPLHKINGIWLNWWDVLLLILGIGGLVMAIESGQRSRWKRWSWALMIVGLGLSQWIQVYRAQQKMTLVVYAIRSGSAIGHTAGRQTAVLLSDSSVAGPLAYAAEAHQMALHGREVARATFAERLSLPSMSYNGAVLALKGFRLLVWHGDTHLRTGLRLDVDAVLLCRGARVDWQRLREVVRGEPVIIVDGSHWHERALELVSDAQAAGFEVHYTVRDGAWVRQWSYF